MASARTRIVRSAPVAASRRALGRAAAPLLRRRAWSGDHAHRLRWVRMLIPGSLGQIPQEIMSLAEHAAARRPRAICEIGTLEGGTSMYLASIAPSLEVFVGIDLEVNNERLIRTLAPEGVRVHFVEGSSRDDSTREQLVRALGGRELDLLFIDGDHAYEGVRADLLNYRDLVRPGGLIGFHDIVPGEGAGGVPKFWGEIRERFTHWEFVADRSGQQGYGIGVIEHDPAVEIA